ncbi:hypothetical protein [Hoeflea sp. YIM 152468]|uniref:hypothetical protein n=1 Tax=Hoeflea sp. YIM 152468 TaxID=3031759 RepID=UPI0023DAD12D|nr:hypothetical protein [Hoeflea sp. YIM 152468]
MTLYPDLVAPSLERMSEKRDLILAENQAAAFLLIPIILLGRIKMLMALLTNERARQAIPQLGIGLIDRYIAEFGILDESRIAVASDLCACGSKRIFTIDAFHVNHPAAPN